MRRIILTIAAFLLAFGVAGAQELKDVEEAYLKIVRKVRPTVVSVTVVKSSSRTVGQNRQQVDISSTQFSGTVVTKEGHIATIGKGVKGASSIYVETLKGARHAAELVGIDERANVGIIKVKDTANWDVKPVEFGDSTKLEVGSLTVIVGCPNGLKHSVVYGNVSGLGRTLVSSMTYYTDMIQLSNPVSHSDPGGLVVNSEGKFVGMVSPAFIKTPSFRRVEELIDALNRKMANMAERLARIKEQEKKDERKPAIPGKRVKDDILKPLAPDLYDPALSQGINFAIPGNLVKQVCDRIIRGKKQPWLGVLVREIEAPEKHQLNLKTGLYVLQVIPNSPAAKGGLRSRDIIVRLGGTPVKRVENLRDIILNSEVGAGLKLSVFRRKQELEISVKLGERK